MQRQRGNGRVLGAAMVAAALVVLSLAASASATLVGEYTKFQQCPWTTAGVNKCTYSLTTGGEVVLGKKAVPIVNPVLLQGGVSEPVKSFSTFFAAKNGETLTPVPQPVPGGLAGIVPPESSPPLVKAALKFFFENGLTGVNATLELARPASEIELSEIHLVEEEEVAVRLPVKVHLENPFLGGSCFVGSNESPIWWNLTTGFTSPPEPFKAIRGAGGTVKLTDEGRILNLTGAEIVDNTWSAPTASGCGGLLSVLVDPIINSQAGLPSKAGENTAILKSAVTLATAPAVQLNDEDN